jgi:hypothetical protein
MGPMAICQTAVNRDLTYGNFDSKRVVTRHAVVMSEDGNPSQK